MSVWEVDFYRRPIQDQQGHPLWELLICSPDRSLQFNAFCPQPEANATWLIAQFQMIAAQIPDRIRVFRPQSLSLVEAACQALNVLVEPTRHTPALKQWLKERWSPTGPWPSQQYPQMDGYTGQLYAPTKLDQPPPLPLPEKLWGEQWRFAALPARDLEEVLIKQPIPVLETPEFLLPSRLQLPTTMGVPGVIIYGGRRSLNLARWLQQQCPVALQSVAGPPSGLVLEAGLVERWIVATFEDPQVAKAAVEFERRKQLSQGLHFLLVQPDDSGVTYSGLWLLRMEN